MSVTRIGKATVDPSARSISVDGRSTRVSPKAMAVLIALFEAEGAVLTRETLLARVWPNVFVCEEVLTQAIAELRRAFGETSKQPQFIETLPKSGYRLLQKPGACEETRDGAFLPNKNAEPRLESLLAYLTASEYLEQRGRQNIESAIDLFQEAIAGAPDFAPAHAGYSFALAYRQNFYRQTENATKLALDSAQKAVRFDRFAPEGYMALGYALSQMGEFEHAVTSYNAALRLRMDSYYSLTRLGRILFMQRNYAAATRFFDRAAAQESGAPHAFILAAKACRAARDNRGAEERLRRAAELCDRKLQTNPDDLRALVCKTITVMETKGVAAASSLIDQLSDEERPFTYYLVGALVRAGEQSLALDRLETIVGNGWADAGFLRADNDLAPLRGEPRFDKIANALAA